MLATCANVFDRTNEYSPSRLIYTLFQWHRQTRCAGCICTPCQENTYIFVSGHLGLHVKPACARSIARYTNSIAKYSRRWPKSYWVTGYGSSGNLRPESKRKTLRTPCR